MLHFAFLPAIYFLIWCFADLEISFLIAARINARPFGETLDTH